MEVKEVLKIKADDFFDTLAQSVLHDISEAEGKAFKEEEIFPGFTYIKKMKNQLGQQGDVHVTIVQFCRPARYQVQFKSVQGINRISYEIRELDGQGIEVDYQENFEGKNTSSSLNYRLLSKLYQRKAKKRMEGMLHSMEAYIQSREKEQKV